MRGVLRWIIDFVCVMLVGLRYLVWWGWFSYYFCWCSTLVGKLFGVFVFNV